MVFEETKTIRDALSRRAKFGGKLNLSAWATALIEVDGEHAIDWLEAVFLGDANRDARVVLDVVKALSVHGGLVQSTLRKRVAECYVTLLHTHPSLAGRVARDLTTGRDWRFTDLLNNLRRERLEMEGSATYAVDHYLWNATCWWDHLRSWPSGSPNFGTVSTSSTCCCGPTCRGCRIRRPCAAQSCSLPR